MIPHRKYARSVVLFCSQTLLFTDPNSTDPWDNQYALRTLLLCDANNVPIATNLATAEMLILGLQRGDLDWRELIHNRR